MVIRSVAIMVVPGLFQTLDYARAVFMSQAELLDVRRGDGRPAPARSVIHKALRNPGRGSRPLGSSDCYWQALVWCAPYDAWLAVNWSPALDSSCWIRPAQEKCSTWR